MLVRSLLAALMVLALAARAEAGEFIPFKSGNATLVGYLAGPAGKGPFPVARQPGDRSNVKLVVYPGAHHGFDIADLGIIPGGVTVQGHRLEHNEAATRDAAPQVRAFLDRTLKD